MPIIKPIEVPFRDEMYDQFGNLARVWIDFWEFQNKDLREAVSAGALSLTFDVPGGLTVGNDKCPWRTIMTPRKPSFGVVYAKTASTGAAIAYRVNVNGVSYFTGTLLATATSTIVPLATIAPLAAIPAFGIVTLDITAVGSGTPGSDFSLLLFL